MRNLFANPDLKIYVCDELLNEFGLVSSRPKIRKYITEDDVEETYKLMDKYCCYIPIREKAISSVRDKKDLYLLSLADTIPADFIITGDKDLLVLGVHHQTKIVTYKVFEGMIKPREIF